MTLRKIPRGPNVEFAIAALAALGPALLSMQGVPISPVWNSLIWLLVYSLTVHAILSLRGHFAVKLVLCIVALLLCFAAWQGTSTWIVR